MTIPKGFKAQIQAIFTRPEKVVHQDGKVTYKLSTWQVIEADVNRNVPSFKSALKNEWRLIKSTFFGAPRNRIQVLPPSTFKQEVVVIAKNDSVNVTATAAANTPIVVKAVTKEEVASLVTLPQEPVLAVPKRVKAHKKVASSVQASRGQKPLNFEQLAADQVRRDTIIAIANAKAARNIDDLLAQKEAEAAQKVAQAVAQARAEEQATAALQVKKAIKLAGPKPTLKPKPGQTIVQPLAPIPEAPVFDLTKLNAARANKKQQVQSDALATGRLVVKKLEIVSKETMKNQLVLDAKALAVLAKRREAIETKSNTGTEITVTSTGSWEV